MNDEPAAGRRADAGRVLGERSVGQVLRAVRGPQHYRALANMPRVYPHVRDAFARYLLGAGAYPARVPVRTPEGVVTPCLHTRHDMLTLNEVFCRLDYEVGGEPRVVVDVGSNIGLSALYFLTRPARPFCYLYEPDPRNVARLCDNLAAYADRWDLAQAAVGPEAGRVRFGTEPTGRYGGIGVAGTGTIEVDCVAINDVLERALTREGRIDVVKLDTEGLEVASVRAMDPALLRRVGAVVFEAAPSERLHPALFTQRQYGSVCRLTRRPG